MILTLVKSYVAPYAKILITALILASAVGATVLIQRWADERCTNKVAEAVKKANTEAEAKGIELNDKYATAVEGIDQELSRIRRKLNAQVTITPECDLSRGTVSLLNAARGTLPETTPLTIEEAASASTITERAAVDNWASDVEQCRKWREQLINLIEWHE